MMPALDPAFCAFCGSLRVVVDSSPEGITRRCPWCRETTIERHDVRADLQREWE
ncbi:MAG TPA: hypothetical protein VFH80_23685 [Solirubrobacteraceae bacterium]|nr:hypothetical protein [Solirubrobacteraceae bacterium]